MDTQGFDNLLKVWYNTVSTMSEGSWALVMDKFRIQERSITCEKRFTPRGIAKHQIPDSGTVANVSAFLDSDLGVIRITRVTNETFSLKIVN